MEYINEKLFKFRNEKESRWNRMKIFKIVLFVVLMTGLHAKEMKWSKMESLEEYSYLHENFKLKDNVLHLKIVWVKNGKSKRINLWRNSNGVIDKKKSKQFHSLKSKYSPKANMRNKGNAFYIDRDGKFWQMDMKEDVISLLGDIDTPAEAQLVLWLHKGQNGKKYLKTSKGYKILVEVNKGKKCYFDEVSVSKKGKLTSKRSKRKCQKIAKKQIIKNRYIKYQRFTDIVIDKKENIYLLGMATDTRSENADVVTIDKYNRNGKKIWQKIIRDGYTAMAEKLALNSKYLYLIRNTSGTDFILKYATGGKLISEKVFDGSNKKNFDATYKRSNANKIKDAPYYRDISGHAISFTKQVRSKAGNIYAVGEEVETIPQKPENIPVGECGIGDADELHGALIVKFDKRGHQIWSKVIDLKW